MKKYKNLIIFIIITLIRSIFLWMLKIFLRSVLKEDGRTLEEVAWYISIWLIFSYFIWWALSYTFRKKPIVIISWLAIICCLLVWFFTDYFPLKDFAIILTIIWFFYGLWLTIKWIITTIEIMESWLSETAINSIINIAILIWILIWSYLGFDAYKLMQNMWFIYIALLLLLSTILTFFLNYDKEFKSHTIYSAITKNIPNIRGSAKKYFKLLIPIWIFWAVSMVLWQKILEIQIDILKWTPLKWMIMIIVSMVWGIIWLALSNVIKKNKTPKTIIITIITGIWLILLPTFVSYYSSYLFMNIYVFILGLLIWVIINLVEARFYHIIWDDHRKEFWSAAYWIISSIFMFIIMLWGNLISKYFGMTACFAFFGIITILTIPFIIKTKDIIQ